MVGTEAGGVWIPVTGAMFGLLLVQLLRVT